MKNKINIDVFVPKLNETFNLFIPVNKSIGEIIKLLNIAINDLTDGCFPISNNLSLINILTLELYDINYSVKDNKISNGSKVVLL